MSSSSASSSTRLVGCSGTMRTVSNSAAGTVSTTELAGMGSWVTTPLPYGSGSTATSTSCNMRTPLPTAQALYGEASVMTHKLGRPAAISFFHFMLRRGLALLAPSSRLWSAGAVPVVRSLGGAGGSWISSGVGAPLGAAALRLYSASRTLGATVVDGEVVGSSASTGAAETVAGPGTVLGVVVPPHCQSALLFSAAVAVAWGCVWSHARRRRS
jgi:hypothetical protein